MNRDLRGVDAIISEMSLRHKVGQMLVAGWDSTAVTPELRQLIAEYHVGGLSLLPRNLIDAAQTAALTTELQQLAMYSGHAVPMWLAADQEGGAILGVRDGLTPFPGAMALGAGGDSNLAYRVGRAIAVEAAAIGINMNYAPVLDVNSNPDNPIIGVRSFGGDPEKVAALGWAFAKGSMEAGVIPVGKHFPGHGDTDVDSHLALPTVRRTLDEAERLELVPFKHAIAQGIPAIMTSHVVFSALDPDYPATLSPAVLTGLLRRDLGFKGLILTDCLEMEAIAAHWPVRVFAVLAVKAGADMLLMSGSADRQVGAIEAIVQAVRDGEIPEERIDDSVRRILDAKLRWILPGHCSGRLPDDWDEIRTLHEALEAEVAGSAVTLVRHDGLLPLDAKSAKVTAIWPHVVPRARTGDQSWVSPLGSVIASVCPNVKTIQFSTVPDDEEISRVVAAVKAAAGTGNGSHNRSQNDSDNDSCTAIGTDTDTNTDMDTDTDAGAGADAGTDTDNSGGTVLVIGTATSRPAEWEAQGRLVERLLALGLPTVVAALRNPYDLRRFPQCRNYLACYSYHPAAIRALVDVLFGIRKPHGTAPVSIMTGGGA